MSPSPRTLIVTADDFGIGPATSRGILNLAKRGVVTSTVLLVNSPFAEEGVQQWLRAGKPVELGWHPCLTLDSPVLPNNLVPTLVDADGRLLKLGTFLKRMIRGTISELEIEAELAAQYFRFVDLVGHVPPAVNGHHHCHIFPPVGRALQRIMLKQQPKPFLRCVREPLATILKVPGGRIKRFVLGHFGKRAAQLQQREGYPGTDTLAGITDPPFVHDDKFFERWLKAIPGDVVELTCHPGELDLSIEGRDGTLEDGQLHRRVREYELLMQPGFAAAVDAAGFALQQAGQGTKRNIAKAA